MIRTSFSKTNGNQINDKWNSHILHKYLFIISNQMNRLNGLYQPAQIKIPYILGQNHFNVMKGVPYVTICLFDNFLVVKNLMHINQLNVVESKRKNQDQISQQTYNSPSGSKNFIGMTLKEYIQSQDPIPLMEEIQEESIDSGINLSNNTSQVHTNQQKDKIKLQTQKDRVKSKHKQELLAIVNNILHLNEPKIPKINIEQLTSFQKKPKKLPIIHKKRSRSHSRNQFQKEDSNSLKKQRCCTLKNQEIQVMNYANTTINKEGKSKKINNIYKNTVEMKKILKSRMTSTSFFNMQVKEKIKMKIKTLEDSDKLDNVFMITRYKQNSLAKRKQNLLKKN